MPRSRRPEPARPEPAPHVELNLATHPAGGYRAFLILALASAAGLVAATAALGTAFFGAGGVPEDLVEQERLLLAEQRRLAEAGAEASANLQGPRAAEVLERTAFLNQLLIRKGVSWTRTFLDLERVLPASVRLRTIQPEVAGNDTIRLEMTVSAKQPSDFIGFLKALEGSELFGSATLQGSAPPDEGDPTFRYQLAVDYDQQP